MSMVASVNKTREDEIDIDNMQILLQRQILLSCKHANTQLNMQILLSIGCKSYHNQLLQSSILNVAEFLDLTLKTSSYMKTSLGVWTNLLKVIGFFCYFLQYDEVFLIRLLYRMLLPLVCFLWIQSMIVQSCNYL